MDFLVSLLSMLCRQKKNSVHLEDIYNSYNDCTFGDDECICALKDNFSNNYIILLLLIIP